MYAALVCIWWGWAVFYGSMPLSVACAVIFLAANFVIIPLEERSLQARFGDAYGSYRRSVPRWIGAAK
jgi:protein-S-isoprenylcysteine O-methyltransferase Ste14